MTNIHILDNSLINKIAAGEVIERPASVVKELMENSLDAESTEIKVDIEEGGFKKIKVTDNGKGMNRDDLKLSVSRHSTSKINSPDDIFSITTLGFRGEALASIAEISHTYITSNPDGSEGYKIEVEAGEIKNEKKVGSPKGTIIEVHDLFFNVPARKKYLKNKNTETQKILRTVTEYAIINHNINIKLVKDGKEVINSPSTNFFNNLIHICGTELGNNLLEVNYESQGVKIKGFITKPSYTKGDKSDQYLYVNKRHIKSDLITEAIYEGYKELLFTQRHPVFFLNITMDPSNVDVNVHPTKREVRFKNEEELYKLVQEGIRETLLNSNLSPQTSPEKETSQEPIQNYSFTKDKQSTLGVGEPKESYESKKTENTQESEQKVLGPFMILGQINKTFIIAESPKGLAVIDQHAAHERVNFEKFMKKLEGKDIKSQKLFKPKVIELNPVQYNVALQNKEKMQELGFEYNDFGNNTIKLLSIPQMFKSLKSTAFLDALNEIIESKKSYLDEEVREKIIMKSCRSSIKAGEELTTPQLNDLLEELQQTQNPYSCPHGRPTIIELSVPDLEKKFKRTGW